MLAGIVVAFTSFTEVGNIHVTITSLKSTQGSLLVCLYKTSEGFPADPKKAWKTAKVAVSGTSVDYRFFDIPFGSYAIALAHDENGNDKVDTNFMGIPKEGIGMSNNARGSFGPPKFADAKFEHVKGETQMVIKVSY